MTQFDAYFDSLKGKNIVVLGLGVSNRPLVRLLLEFGCDVTGCDRTPREKLDEEVLELEKDGCRLSLGDTYLDGIEADVVFRTPGMHPENPDLVALREAGAEVVVLAGFMRILTGHFISRWEHKIINIHPALLPKFGGKDFYGIHVHEAVLEAGETESGATVHYVDEGVDTGKDIIQGIKDIGEMLK